MLAYQTDKSDPTKEVSTGVHISASDTPVDYVFTLDHAKGASQDTIRADVDTHLAGQGRVAELVEKEGKYRVVEYDANGQITSVKRYATDNGDGTYDDLVEEDVFVTQGGRVISETNKKYKSDGNVEGQKQFNYFSAPDGLKLIRKEA
jgi:hypothetical protein